MASSPRLFLTPVMSHRVTYWPGPWTGFACVRWGIAPHAGIPAHAGSVLNADQTSRRMAWETGWEIRSFWGLPVLESQHSWP